MKSKLFSKTMYPEIEKAGGLTNALNLEFAKINSLLKVSTNGDLDKLPFTYARVENGGKFSQIYIAAEEKLYLPDFWKDGVCLAHAQTSNILDVLQAVDFWLNHDVSTQVLAERFNFVQPSAKARAFDENKEVEYTWNLLLQDDSKGGLQDFIKLAINDDVLTKLFPFTSLYTLCFSRCTGYPYDTENLPNVTPKQFGHFAPIENNSLVEKINDLETTETLFVVTKNKNEYLGEGNAEEALKIVKDNLPDNIEPAVKGTVED